MLKEKGCHFFETQCCCNQSINQSLFESGKSPYTNRHTHIHTHTCTKRNHNIQ